MRTEMLSDFAVPADCNDYLGLVKNRGYTDSNSPSRLELHLGNLCNLKCLTCNPADSSAFLEEDRSLGITTLTNKMFTLDESKATNIIATAIKNGVEILDLRGGETMLMPAVQKHLEMLPSDHKIKRLRVQTNGTTLSDSWKSILSKFENVEIMISVDAYDQDNHYIRYPSNWDQIEKTVDYVLSINAHTYIHTTLSNLNFLVVDKLIKWTKQKGIYFHCSPLTRPSKFCYTNLPEQLFNIAKDRLEEFPEMAMFTKEKPNSKEWADFCKAITLRDNYRKNSIFSVVPEFKHYWT